MEKQYLFHQKNFTNNEKFGVHFKISLKRKWNYKMWCFLPLAFLDFFQEINPLALPLGNTV